MLLIFFYSFLIVVFTIPYGFLLANENKLNTYHYTKSLIYGIIFGYMIWNEIPAWNTYVGAGFIILSAIFILRRETALKKEIQPEKFSIQR